MLIADSCEDPEAVIQLKHRLETLMAKALENILNKKGSHKDSTRLEILPDKVIGRIRYRHRGHYIFSTGFVSIQ